MKSTARLQVGVLLVLIVVALVSSLGVAWYTGDWEGLALNFGTEMAGAVVTYLLLELVIGRKEELEAKEKEIEVKRADLIAQMGSSVKDVAIAAAEELRRHGWLQDGSLQGTYLCGVNLQGAALARADLRRADLAGADLAGAELLGANLQGADLLGANLQRAILVAANLQGASIDGTNLQEAMLDWANLQGASLDTTNLQGAYLAGANLQGAFLNEDTTLPDGTNWTPDTDIARFTDPNHPDFWRPGAQ